jgi:hypothetical protein
MATLNLLKSGMFLPDVGWDYGRKMNQTSAVFKTKNMK